MFCLLLCCFAIVIPSCANNDEIEGTDNLQKQTIPKRYEAEQAMLSANAVVENTIQGFSGTGYVNQKDGDITFKIAIEAAGKYSLTIRYATDNQRKENVIYINGNRLAKLTFDPTTDWRSITLNKINLKAGENTITIKKEWGWMYYDYIEISDVVAEKEFDIANTLVTTNSTPEAIKLYGFLKENFGKKVISGAMANYSTGLEEANWIHEQTGKWVALVGLDLIDYNRSWDWIDHNALTNNAKQWWINNGIVSVMWHWRDPSRATDHFYTDSMTFDVRKISDPQSLEYKAMIKDIDLAAGYLKQLKDAKVPVLWRPLHEASGGWFWWGAKGAEPCKTLWKLMYDRLVNYHGLNNLIWVWTSDAADNAKEWYPGDAYVDIIGMDIYPGEGQHGSQYIAFDRVKELFGGRKIIALSECGSIPYIDDMFEYGDTWSWIMPWNGYFTRSDKENGAAFFINMFQNTKVITRDQMPSLK